MSQLSEMEHHQHQLADMRNIMNAMKNLAYMEHRKLSGLLLSQRQMLSNLEKAAADFLSFHPYPETIKDSPKCIYLLMGSERGFCGSFNEKLLQALDEQVSQYIEETNSIIIVGQKLARHFEADPRVAAFIDGANFEEEIAQILNTMVSAISLLQKQHGIISLVVLYHSDISDQINRCNLLPPFHEKFEAPGFTYPPLLNIQAEQFFTDLSEQYLFAALHEIAYTSLMIENHWRVQHLEGAVNRLDSDTDTLRQKCRTLRQEEITEEIEVILLGADSMLQSSKYKP